MFDLSVYGAVGFSGSRDISTNHIQAIVRKLNALQTKILVGCADGVDACVRSYAPDARVFSVDRSAPQPEYKGAKGGAAFAKRSQDMIDHLAKEENPLLIAFPGGSAPVGLTVGKGFAGLGSGTWATISYAAGKSIPVIVFCREHELPWNGWIPSESGNSFYYKHIEEQITLDL